MRYTFWVILAALGVMACGSAMDDNWVLTKDISVTPYKSDPENGKQYLDVIFENGGKDNIRKLKIELLERTGSKIDTLTREIIPTEIVHPKDRHLAKRPLGEPPATFDEVMVGRVWIVKE